MYAEFDHATLDMPLPKLSRVSSVIDGSDESLVWHTDEGLFAATGVTVAFTTRHGGCSEFPYSSLNLGTAVGDDPYAVSSNRHRILEALGLGDCARRLVCPLQVHGTSVLVLGEDIGNGQTDRGQDSSACSRYTEDVLDDIAAAGDVDAQAGCDAVLCKLPAIPVLLCYADCVPLIAVAPNGCFCVIHAGWRGTLAGIAGKACTLLAQVAGCGRQALNVYIGPHIRACCYETSEEILADFREAFDDSCDHGNRHLSLEDALYRDLDHCGVARARTVSVGICTADATEDYYSYRAQGGVCGRHGAIACRTARND